MVTSGALATECARARPRRASTAAGTGFPADPATATAPGRAAHQRRADRGGAARAAGVPADRGARSRRFDHGAPDLPPAHRRAAVEHGQADRRGHRAVRGHRHRDRLVHRAHRPARPALVGGTRRGTARDPRLRGQLRLVLAVDLDARLPGRGDRAHARRLPAGLPAGRGQPAQRRPGPGRGSPQPRQRPGRARSSGSRWPRPEVRSWAAACWSRWCCSPNSERSRSSATRRSPPRSSPSSTP